MNKEQHRMRHIGLHEALDELFADYITHHPEQLKVTETPILTILKWSNEQTKNPTE